MRIPFLDLQSAYAVDRDELDAAYRRVMASGRFLLGPELEAFESEFARAVGADHAVGAANGLEALQLVLMAAGVGPGDEVVVPANGYIATWFAVSQVGAVPVPCEPDPATYNLDPGRLGGLLTERTKVILPIHLYGQPADMPAIRGLAERRGIFVLEDAAQAHGARCHGRCAGALGNAAGFSFYPTKNLGAFADAGAVTTGDARLAAKVRQLRNYGSTVRYRNESIGLNSRMEELQAAFLRVKLRRLAAGNAHRAHLAARYREGLAAVGDLILPTVPDWAEPCWHLFVIRTRHRDALRKHLAAAEIATDIHYPTPPHLAEAYRQAGWRRGDFPIAETLAAECLSLPLNPELSVEAVDQVCASVREYFQKA